MSPGCSSNASQFNVSPSSLGGVPVFSLPTGKSNALSFFASLLLAGSPILPPDSWCSPVCITPPKKVPVVKMTLFAFMVVPESSSTPLTLPPLIIMSSTDPSKTSKLFSLLSRSCMDFL